MTITTINYSDPFDFSNPHVQRIIDRITTINRKVLAQDCENSNLLHVIACWYASQYNGTFPFMLDMAKSFNQRGKLSAAQTAGTLNCMMNDYRYAQKRASVAFKMPEADLPADLGTPLPSGNRVIGVDVVPSSDPVTPVCLNGTYTIVLNESGDYRTLRLVDTPDHMGKPEGTQIAQYLSGSDNEADYIGFAFVSGAKIGVWSKFKADSKLAKALQVLLSADRAAQIDLGEAYAVESGNCFACGRKLTVPASLSRGLGPICAAKFGL